MIIGGMVEVRERIRRVIGLGQKFFLLLKQVESSFLRV
jgi:hypothetical protein